MRHLQALIIFSLLLVCTAQAAPSHYSGTPVIALNDGMPSFSEDYLGNYAFVQYSELDELGRVGVAIACIGPEFPVGARSSIYTIEPTGWKSVWYDFVPGGYLYNRSHLIAHRFSGGGEVIENLFTGTQFLNQDSMAAIETVVADYVERTGHHVMYRVTPDFRDDELICRGVEIEAQSVEDTTVSFHIYLYNVEPGVAIDYRTGESRMAEYEFTSQNETRQAPMISPKEQSGDQEQIVVYVLNIKTKRFHYPTCHSVTDMKPQNRKDYTGTRDELIEQGYKPCGECKP